MLGKHNGYWFHTIGQRKGLGLSGGPWFVIKKDIKRNIIYVSNGYDPETQYGKIINMHGFDFITEDPWGEFEDEKEITFKIRHTPDFTHGASVASETYTASNPTTKSKESPPDSTE